MPRFACEWPEMVWLGMTRGTWPIAAFGSESAAARWALDGDGADRFIRGPIMLGAGWEEQQPVYVPAVYALEPRVPAPTPTNLEPTP